MLNLKQRGFGIVTVDTARQPCFSDLVEASLHVPGLKADVVIPVVREYHQRYLIDGVARFHELSVPIANEVALALELPHVAPELIDVSTNKYAMRSRMSACGIACPAFGAARTVKEARRLAAELGFPVVIKPQVGGASFGVTRLDDMDAVDRFFEHAAIFWEPRIFIIERFLPGSEISVETITFERPQHIALFEKPQILDGPFFLEHTFVTPSRYDQVTVEAAYAAVSSMILRLGLQCCITHTELRLTPQGPMVLEFGMRPIGYPGSLCVRHTTGVDLIEAMGLIAIGRDDLTHTRPASAYCGWRYLTVPRAGRLAGVRNVEQARGLEGVVSCHIWARDGQALLLPPQGFNYILGYVAAEGASFDQVCARLEQAQAAIQIDVVA
ncbi:MAG: ATP-grasp domain-containing protein [Chloroflexales bacterium]|nr:ATP-grasp domain-containing protein [Chloroflexales bacterium]